MTRDPVEEAGLESFPASDAPAWGNASADTPAARTVLVTGASSGLGRATSELFAARGWNVIATMRRPEPGAAISGAENVLIARLDVTDRDSVERAFEAGIACFGSIQLVINNAGYGLIGIFETTPVEKIAEQFAVNVFGVMNVTRAAIPHLRANGGGVILNVSSGAGVFGAPLASLYCASKFALEGFSESLSYELASQGIVVKIVEPGGVLDTKFAERSGREAAANGGLGRYEEFMVRTAKAFEQLRKEASATAQDVAEVIHRAATDGTDRLRYVATDDIAPMVKARRESSEASYVAFMRSRFFHRAREG
jgi:NAD(P)-dependent dehydrogenase (short-subunit alcohol dehydrogenase family)